MAFKLTDLSDRGPDTSSQQFTHFNSFRSVRAMFCIFADMCCFLCYIIGDKTDQKRVTKTSVTLTCDVFVLYQRAGRSQQQPVSLRYVGRAQPPLVREDGSDFISSSHIATEDNASCRAVYPVIDLGFISAALVVSFCHKG